MNRYLLDTQVWLWLLNDSKRLDDVTRARLAATSNDLLLSAASSWEIAIKYRLGKLQLPEPPQTYVPDRMRRSGVTPLVIEHAHTLRVADLPDHHRDPFDRLIVAQGQVMNVPIVTADPAFDSYDVEVLPVGR